MSDRLRGEILAGRLAAGARLPSERELSLALGVNRLTLRAALARLEAEHVRNFLDSIKAGKMPNSDVVSGHRSALASNLGKIAYVQKRRITFNPAGERVHVLPPATQAKN